MLKRYHSNMGFVDLLFNSMIGVIFLLLMTFLLINPIAEQGKIDPVTELMIQMSWDEESIVDVDLWVEGPDGSIVFFAGKDKKYMVLDRDDRGTLNDTFEVNGEEVVVKKNLEVLNINGIHPGRYVVNVFYFSSHVRDPVQFEVSLFDMRPFALVNTTRGELSTREEQTAFIFEVDHEGKVTEVRTGEFIRVRNIRGY